MKINRSLLFAALFPAFFIFSSCEKTEMFKSEKTIKKQLVGSWSLILIPNDPIRNPNQTWVFDDSGNLQLTVFRSSGTVTGTGRYEIKTTLTKVEIKIKELNINEDYNAVWQVVLLDNDVLVMANDHSGATGIKELDFQKRN